MSNNVLEVDETEEDEEEKRNAILRFVFPDTNKSVLDRLEDCVYACIYAAFLYLPSFFILLLAAKVLGVLFKIDLAAVGIAPFLVLPAVINFVLCYLVQAHKLWSSLRDGLYDRTEGIVNVFGSVFRVLFRALFGIIEGIVTVFGPVFRVLFGIIEGIVTVFGPVFLWLVWVFLMLIGALFGIAVFVFSIAVVVFLVKFFWSAL